MKPGKARRRPGPWVPIQASAAPCPIIFVAEIGEPRPIQPNPLNRIQLNVRGYAADSVQLKDSLLRPDLPIMYPKPPGHRDRDAIDPEPEPTPLKRPYKRTTRRPKP